MSEAPAPAPAPAAKPKRSFFNRPKWAAANNPENAVRAPRTPVRDDDFFSRSNETYAAIAAEEQEREKRRLERRAHKKETAPTLIDDSRPSPKRRRISTEAEDDTSDGGDHPSDIEAVEVGRADVEGAAGEGERQAKSKEFTATLGRGRDSVKDGMITRETDLIQMRCPSPGSLPADVPRIPTDDDCDRIRSKDKSLRPCDNATIRRLALLKWEQKHGSASEVSTPDATRRVTRSSAQSASSGAAPAPTNGDTTPRPQPSIIDLADDDEPPQSAVSFASSYATALMGSSQNAISITNDVEHGDETAELEQKASEEAHQKQPGCSNVSHPPATGGPDRAVEKETFATGTSRTDPAPVTEPFIQLLVTSEIPGTRALVIKRDIGQRFKEVKEYWSNANNIPPDVRSKLHLTWKKRRLYDSQNCKRLGFSAGPDGSVIYRDTEDDMFDDYQGKIHLVAVVDGMPGSESTATPTNGTGAEPATQTSLAPVPAPADAPEPEMRIIIRSKGYPECKLIVKPSTLIQRLIFAFKKSGKIPDGKNVALMFDGELLQHNATVGQTEIDDMDNIDAYVR